MNFRADFDCWGTSAIFAIPRYFRWIFDDLNFREVLTTWMLGRVLTVMVPAQFYHSNIILGVFFFSFKILEQFFSLWIVDQVLTVGYNHSFDIHGFFNLFPL